MGNSQIEKREAFKEILKKATVPKPLVNFTDAIMENILIADVRSKAFNKNIKRSWLFILIAVLLSIVSVSQLTYVELAFMDIVNKYLPGIFEVFTFTLLSFLAGLFFYQLNNLLTYQFSETEKK